MLPVCNIFKRFYFNLCDTFIDTVTSLNILIFLIRRYLKPYNIVYEGC